MADARTALARRLAGVSMPSTMEGFGVDPDEVDRQGSYDAEGGAELARMVGATGAAAADPLGIPSAITGMVSPDARDSWRAYQASEGVAPQVAGSLVGGYGGMSAAMKGARGVGDLVARTAGAAAGSDVIDAAAGKDNAINRQTLAKAMLGPVGALPGRAANAALGAAGGGMLMSGEAQAQSLTPQMRARQEELRAKRRLNSREATELQRLNDVEAASAGAEAAAQRQAAEEERRRAAMVAEEERQRKVAGETEAGGRAQATYDKVMSEKSPSYKETWWGRNVNPGLAPLITGIATGALTGGKTARAQRASAEAWEKALANAKRTDIDPSVRLAAQADAAAIKSTMPADVSPLKGYGLPVAAGGVEGAGSTGIAQLWDRNLPDENPERVALAAAIAELPQGHPDRARYESRLNDPNLSLRNPAKVAAESRTAGDLAVEAATRAGVGMMGGVAGKTVAGLFAPSAQSIGRMRALTPDTVPDITPEATAAEALKMRGVQQADVNYQSGIRRLDAGDRLDAAAAQLEQEALAGIVAKGAPKEVQQAVRQKLAEALARKPPQQELPPPPPEVVSNPARSTSLVPVDSDAGIIPPAREEIVQKLLMPQGMRPNVNWEPYSERARASVLSQMDQGGSLRPASGKGGGSSITARQVAEDIGEGGPTVKVTQNAMTRLREVMAANGIDPSTATRQQVAALFEKLDPRIFAVPAVIGAGAATMGETEATPPEPEMSSEQRARMILARQMAGAPAY